MGALCWLPQVAPGVVRFDREFRAASEHCGAVVGSSSVELLRFKGTMGATAAEFMLDSGASTNFVDQALVKRMGWQMAPTTKRVKLPDGSVVPAAGTVKMECGARDTQGKRIPSPASSSPRHWWGSRPSLACRGCRRQTRLSSSRQEQ